MYWYDAHCCILLLPSVTEFLSRTRRFAHPRTQMTLNVDASVTFNHAPTSANNNKIQQCASYQYKQCATYKYSVHHVNTNIVHRINHATIREREGERERDVQRGRAGDRERERGRESERAAARSRSYSCAAYPTPAVTPRLAGRDNTRSSPKCNVRQNRHPVRAARAAKQQQPAPAP